MYIAIDMGTSNTRLWLCDGNNVLYFIKGSFGAGITKIFGKENLFLKVKDLINSLLEKTNTNASEIECIIASGMAGSELGLADIPRVPLPACIYTLAENLKEISLSEITPIPFLFVPGLKKCKGNSLSDVIRGEETEVIGTLNLVPEISDSVLILPGTHNKVISISKDGSITDFYTTMSGELLHAIITNSILAGTVSHDFTPDCIYLKEGAEYAQENGLNAALFKVRVMSLNGVSSDKLSSFLHGSVLGQDVKTILKTAKNKPIYIGGNETLKQIYHILLGTEVTPVISENAVQAGLSAILDLYHTIKSRNDILNTISSEKLIAIIRNPYEETLISAVKALYRGGIRLVEVTFDRSGKVKKEETAKFIKMIKENTPMLAGAGTVTSLSELKLAKEAGASYIISPNCNVEIIRHTRNYGLVSIPAAYTPTEIAKAIDAGADYVKIFPANDLPKGYVKAIKAPLSDAKLLAVGGVNEDNAKDFLEDGFSGVGVGSNLYDKDLISTGNWQELEKLANRYVKSLQK